MPGKGKRKAKKARRQAGKAEAERLRNRTGRDYRWFAGRVRDYTDANEYVKRSTIQAAEKASRRGGGAAIVGYSNSRYGTNFEEPGDRIRRERRHAGNARNKSVDFDNKYPTVQRVVDGGRVTGFRYGGRVYRDALSAKQARAADRVEYYRRN